MQLGAATMGVLVVDSSSTACWTPPPKKKWIRHYLLEEEEEQFPAPASPPAAPPQPPPPPPPPPAPAPSRPAHVTNGAAAATSFPQQLESAASLLPPGDDAKDFQKRAAGTREVHNKLEKNRRAHLKECFELLKKQLPASQDEKKSSNLSILHSALRYIQSLRRKERELEHEMERLAREKIAAQQRLANLKKDLSAQWDHIDFTTLLPDTPAHEDADADGDPRGRDRDRERDHLSHTTSTASERDDMMSDAEEPLSKCGVIYSSTSSLSSAATASSPPQPSELHGHGGEGPKAPPTPTPTATPTATPASLAQHHVQLPVSAHMVSTGPSLAATLVSPTIQLLTPSALRMLPAEPQPLALTVHHTSSQHLPTTTVTSHHRLRDSPDIRTTAAISLPTLHLTNKMVASSVTLAEATRLPGGTELNILPANGTLRGGKHHPITLTGGLTLPNGVLSHAGVTLTTKSTPLSLTHAPVSEGGTVLAPAIHSAGTIPTHLTSAGITHVVAPLGSHHAGLTPLMTPVTVVSQGNQVAHILATPQQIGGKMMTTTPLLKSVGPMPVMNAQYLSAAALVKPVVVVSSASTLPPHTNT